MPEVEHDLAAGLDLDLGLRPIILHLHPESRHPRPGPYVVHRFTGDVFAVSKFFPDTQKAFCYGVTESPEREGTFEPTLISVRSLCLGVIRGKSSLSRIILLSHRNSTIRKPLRSR